jgi:Predicted amidohydrolase
VLINSSAWPFPRLEHLRILALTRAIENQSYLIVANRVGSDDGVTFCGTSVIIDPYGVIVAAASADREELIQAEISQDVIDAVRQRMAVFEHREQTCINQTAATAKWRRHFADDPVRRLREPRRRVRLSNRQIPERKNMGQNSEWWPEKEGYKVNRINI